MFTVFTTKVSIHIELDIATGNFSEREMEF